MNISRREFLQMLAVASAAGVALPGQAASKGGIVPNQMYELPAFGNVSFLHFTDCHAQLMPIWFREPNINIGVSNMKGNPPHLVGKHFLKHYGIAPNTPEANAFTYLNFVEASKQYGKVGGFAHLATLVKHIRAQRPESLLLDGGDTWQGSATALWTNGQDMVDATKLLGVDVMTGHWEFTYGAERVNEIIENDLEGHMDFVAQNVIDNQWEEDVFKPYVIKEMNGIPTAIIGQAFPYTPIANPRWMIPEWSFGIRDDKMQGTVDAAREAGAQVVVVLSHNGMDVDLKMASRVRGIDAILGGHTHDAVPEPVKVNNAGGTTLVINSGSNGKFLSVLDFDVKNGKVRDFRYRLLPIFSNFIEPDVEMGKLISNVRKPYIERLNEQLGVADEVLYRRGNFNGTFDQLILDAMLDVQEADIAFSPGFRWGVSVMPGEPITFEHVMTQTAITYPTATLNEVSGEQIKVILEDVADNLFNEDPYYQQGGDMVRVGGLKYSIDPTAKIGKRITDMELNGKPLDARKNYRLAGWASIEKREGTPIWDVVTEYIRAQDTVRIKELNIPKIKGLGKNPGLAEV
ncbi:Sulfur oxidation protein SoxB [hydrothermal vent metagenome]|uniref:Sulfur oxidation protein SoxB n=1 Tax=hydrothermal vent metagenome TaxID=652676 RepID=A0A3B1ACT2_9ZZZZ